MHAITFTAGLLLILVTLFDGFETILLPRRINHRFRYSRLYYRNCWRLWRALATSVSSTKWREAMLGVFGPMSLLGLFVSWVTSLILGFTVLQWSLAGLLFGNGQRMPHSFATYLYYSGTTYFTSGLGDVIPSPGPARVLTVLEGGVGFGFLAIIISYLPILYQAFSRREVTISLLDARAGSPPTGGDFIRRLTSDGRINIDDAALREWERWCAELLESHVSFPVLAFYRSQHSNQSWLAAMTAMLDACSALLTLFPGVDSHQAQVTFAMARHAAVDTTLIFGIQPPQSLAEPSRQDMPAQLNRLLQQSGYKTEDFPKLAAKFNELRGMYEPFVEALARHFLLTLPPVVAVEHIDDNWQRSPWMARTPGIGKLPAGNSATDHFA